MKNQINPSSLKEVAYHAIKSQDAYSRCDTVWAPLMSLVKRLEDGVYVELHGKVFCKNYIGEYVFSAMTGIRSPCGNPANSLAPDFSKVDEFALMYRFKSAELRDAIIPRLKKLNRLEKTLGFKETVASKVKDKDTDLIIHADPKWASSLLLISIHIQFIRVLTYNSNKLNIFNHVQELTKRAKSSYQEEDERFVPLFRDLSYLEIINKHIDLVFLINNIDKIVTNNTRYTGLNDIAIKKNVRSNNTLIEETVINVTLEREVDIEYPVGTVLNSENYLNIRVNTKKEITTLSFNYVPRVHDFSGIYNLATTVKDLRDIPKEAFDSLNFKLTTFSVMGGLWAYNYIREYDARK